MDRLTWQKLSGYIRTEFLKWMAWRGFALTLAANQVVIPLAGLAVWSTALPGRGMGGYYTALLLVRLMTVSYENHTLSTRIYGGEIADDLLRPHPAVLAPLGENLAIRLWHLIIGLPLLAGALLLLPYDWRTADLLLALPALALAAALRFLFTYLLALSAFWTERADSLVNLGATLVMLLGGEVAPVRELPPALQELTLLLPFRAMSGFPAEVAAGWLPLPAVLAGYGVQAFWVAAMAALSARLWFAGVRRYTAVGG